MGSLLKECHMAVTYTDDPLHVRLTFAFSGPVVWYESNSQKVNSVMDGLANYQRPEECGLKASVRNQR